MFPALLITFREVIEAALIVATILGILTKTGQKTQISVVWSATATAFAVSLILLVGASFLGLEIRQLYTGATEALIEGSLMIVSAMFITWAVFVLHNQFGHYKTTLLSGLRSTIESNGRTALFFLVFSSVFREGFEIVLFLSTIYVSSTPGQIMTGFSLGLFSGLAICMGLFTATMRLPVYYAFKSTSALLIVFAAGLLARGVHEFMELGVVPELFSVKIPLFANIQGFAADMFKAMFGITGHMDILQIAVYMLYVASMIWWVYLRRPETQTNATD